MAGLVKDSALYNTGAIAFCHHGNYRYQQTPLNVFVICQLTSVLRMDLTFAMPPQQKGTNPGFKSWLDTTAKDFCLQIIFANDKSLAHWKRPNAWSRKSKLLCHSTCSCRTRKRFCRCGKSSENQDCCYSLCSDSQEYISTTCGLLPYDTEVDVTDRYHIGSNGNPPVSFNH